MYDFLSKVIVFDDVKLGDKREFMIGDIENEKSVVYIGGNDFVTFSNGQKFQFEWHKISEIKPLNLYKDVLFGPLCDLEEGDTLQVKSKNTDFSFIRNEFGLFKVLPSGRYQTVLLNYSDRED